MPPSATPSNSIRAGVLARQCCFLAAIFYFLFHISAHAGDQPVREPIEWTDTWIAHADKTDLPRVLLVGDSITRGYYDAVDKALEGRAYCARYCTSKFIGHADFLAELTILLDAYAPDIIHMNSGLHGWGYTEEQYAAAFAPLFDVLAKHAPKAKIVWASSTPMRNAQTLTEFDPMTDRVRARNRIAREAMQGHGIPIDDLFTLVETHSDYYAKDGVHFNDAGRATLAKQVTDAILVLLATP